VSLSSCDSFDYCGNWQITFVWAVHRSKGQGHKFVVEANSEETSQVYEPRIIPILGL